MNQDCCDLGGLLTDGLDENAELLVTRAFTAIWSGAMPTPADIAGDIDTVEATEVVRRLASVGRCELDDDGERIVGAHGITHNPTVHEIVHAGGRHYTWCAFEAVGIPAALAIDATARTTCPQCGTAISVRIVAGEPVDGGPMVVWLPSEIGEHLIEDFCSQSNIFCSAAHHDTWLDGWRREGQVVTLAEAADIGRATWADVAHTSNHLEPE